MQTPLSLTAYTVIVQYDVTLRRSNSTYMCCMQMCVSLALLWAGLLQLSVDELLSTDKKAVKQL